VTSQQAQAGGELLDWDMQISGRSGHTQTVMIHVMTPVVTVQLLIFAVVDTDNDGLWIT
jgi:hypothetical protein